MPTAVWHGLAKDAGSGNGNPTQKGAPMPVQLRCPNPSCGRTLPPASDLGGETLTLRCPGCGQTFSQPSGALEEPQYPPTLDPQTHASTTTPSSHPMPSPSVLQEVPRQIGRFVIRAHVGAGACATVYRAHDPQLDRDVALKVPHAGTLDTPQSIERFLGEAKAAARLRHPRIVPVYEAGSDGSTYYIASAFIEGRTLAQRFGNVPLPPRRAAEIVHQLALALAYAHRLGVVHRDVKPCNVLMDEEGNAYLTDFGLAYRLDTGRRLTRLGTIMGTPAYMAPEQAAGRRDEPDPACDQYSLGAVLYKLLCGEPPFSGELHVILYQVQHSAPVPPRKRNPRIPAELERICLKALAREPQMRYGSCQ